MTKGFLFGASLILLALVVLGLSVSVKTADENMLRMGVFGRIDDEIKSAENGFRHILSKFTVVDISGNNITFSGTLFNTPPDFHAFVDNFREFVERNSSFALRADTSSVGDNMMMTIGPAGIVYGRPDGLNGETIEITNARDVLGYSIIILLNRTGATPVEWKDGPFNDTNGIVVGIVTGGLTGNDFSFSGNLSRTHDSRLRIKLPQKDMYITIGDDDETGKLEIENDNNNVAAFVNVTLTVNATQLSVVFPGLTINITAGEYNISRIASVRIA